MVDLLGLNVHDLAWYQMAVRAAVVFVLAMAFIRVAGVRSFGNRASFDVVLSITIGAILSRCITGHYPFFPCLIAAATLALLHRLTAFANHRWAPLRKLIEGQHVTLFEKNQLYKDRQARHCISDEDIQRAMHEENIDDLGKIKSLIYETDGRLAVVKKEE